MPTVYRVYGNSCTMKTNVHIIHIVTDTVHTHMYIHGDTYACSRS